MSKDIEAFQDTLARLDRLETVLSHKVDRIAASEQALVKWRKEMTLEVEELKVLKHTLEESLPEAVQTSLKQNIQLILKQLLSPLVKEFQERTDDFIKSSLKEGQKVEKGIDRAIAEANEVISYRKEELTLRRIKLGFFLFFTPLLTAAGIFYYFPQHRYFIQKHETTPLTAKLIVLGESLAENFEKLTPEQKTLFNSTFIDKLNKPGKQPK